VDARHVVGVLLHSSRLVGRDQELVVRHDPRRPVDEIAVLHEQGRARERRAEPFVHELVQARPFHRHAEEEEPQEHRELVRVAEPAQVGRQLRRPRQQLLSGGQPFLDPLAVVAGGTQPAREVDAVLDARGARRVRPPGRSDGADGLGSRGRPRG
jgi:hypothetical protein